MGGGVPWSDRGGGGGGGGVTLYTKFILLFAQL